MINDKIDTDHEPWKTYHEKKDLLDATHSLVEVDGVADLYNMAIEVPNEQLVLIMKLMQKEVDASNRFSLTDGLIQGEFEIWDGDYEKHLYFCVDFTLKQAIKFSKQKNPTIGFVPIGRSQITIGGQKIFRIDDIKEFIKIKMMVDARPNRPVKWKVG